MIDEPEMVSVFRSVDNKLFRQVECIMNPVLVVRRLPAARELICSNELTHIFSNVSMAIEVNASEESISHVWEGRLTDMNMFTLHKTPSHQHAVIPAPFSTAASAILAQGRVAFSVSAQTGTYLDSAATRTTVTPLEEVIAFPAIAAKQSTMPTVFHARAIRLGALANMLAGEERMLFVVRFLFIHDSAGDGTALDAQAAVEHETMRTKVQAIQKWTRTHNVRVRGHLRKARVRFELLFR